MTPDHTAFQVRSSWYGRAGIGRYSGNGFNTGCHEKAPVGCSPRCSAHDVFVFADIHKSRMNRFILACKTYMIGDVMHMKTLCISCLQQMSDVCVPFV